MINKIILVIVLCFGLNALSQENLIYQQIQNERLNGEKFTPVYGVFKQDKLDPVVAKEFKNSKEVSFFQFDAKAISHKERSLSLDLPLGDTNLVMELIAIEDSFYDYEVYTDKGKVIPANRNIKHYRGVIKSDPKSLVALTFFEDEVGGIIANEKGNFNIGTIKNKKEVIFYKDDNLLVDYKNHCNMIEIYNEFDGKEYVKEDKNNFLAQDSLFSYCVKINLDVAYDIYQDRSYNYLRTEQYITSIFNQTALLYQNESIRIEIGTIRIWTTPDPFVSLPDINANHLISYRDYLNGNFSSHISMFFTEKESAGIAYVERNEFIRSLCSNKKSKVGISGILGDVKSIPNYSRPIKVVAHELGHILGSYHTHDCKWNGNNTAIDGCGPLRGYPSDPGGCSTAPIPQQGSIMSYCDGYYVGNWSPSVSFSVGFGPQPGNVLRSTVASSIHGTLLGGKCVGRCTTTCLYNMWANSPVSEFIYDAKQVSNKIIATNTIESGGTALYYGNSIQLQNGFKASEGATFIAKVEPCAPNSLVSFVDNSLENTNIVKEAESVIKIYPNPTSDNITITSDKEIVYWELFNEVGYLSASSKVAHQKEFQVNLTHLKKGLYLIRFTRADGTTNAQKVIKK